MGDLINLDAYRSRKEIVEAEELSEDIQRLQADLKKLISELEDPVLGPIYDVGYDDLMSAFRRVDSALDGYATVFCEIMNVSGSIKQEAKDDNIHYYEAAIFPEDEEEK